MRFAGGRNGAHRDIKARHVVLFVLGGMAILLSPLVLVAVGSVRGVDWARLSEIGQAYGAASAVISALALVGVMFSLVVQTRQVRVSQIDAVRSMQLELAKLALSDPVFAKIWGVAGDASSVISKQASFTNLVFKYLQMGYVTGAYGEAELRSLLRGRFELIEVQQWWGAARDTYEREVSTAEASEFVRIADDELERSRVPIAEQPPSEVPSQRQADEPEAFSQRTPPKSDP